MQVRWMSSSYLHFLGQHYLQSASSVFGGVSAPSRTVHSAAATYATSCQLRVRLIPSFPKPIATLESSVMPVEPVVPQFVDLGPDLLPDPITGPRPHTD